MPTGGRTTEKILPKRQEGPDKTLLRTLQKAIEGRGKGEEDTDPFCSFLFLVRISLYVCLCTTCRACRGQKKVSDPWNQSYRLF